MTKNCFALSTLLLLVLITASKASDGLSNQSRAANTLVFEVSAHDARLKEMVKFLGRLKYADLDKELLAQPTADKITSSLWQTEKCIYLPWSLYCALFAGTMKKFKEGGTHNSRVSQECCAYLQDQFMLNKQKALVPCYTALLVFSHPSIALPVEISKKIITLMELDAQVFKPDILLMFRIASSGRPETLDSNLYALYKPLCGEEFPMLPLKMSAYYGTLKGEFGFSRSFELDEIIIKKDLYQQTKQKKDRRTD